MKFNYYEKLLEQAKRTLAMCEAEMIDAVEELKLRSNCWRDEMTDRLYTDFLPPIERRDLLTLVQNMCYVYCETAWAVTARGVASAEGMILKKALQQALQVYVNETAGIKNKTCLPTRLRKSVWQLINVWRDCVASGCKPTLSDSFEAAADALLRYADALETTVIVG